MTILADRYEGKRLNSPNDLVYKSDGSLYFTDPPFGLPKAFDDPRKETPFSGVYRWSNGKLQLLTTDMTGPNGLAFSPDEKYLYVGNWDEKKKIVMRYEVKPDGTLANGRVFFDMTSAPGEDAIDGLKVDRQGNVYVSGPGGLWILSPAGKHLGTIVGPEHPHNFAWGDADGKTLYLTAQTGSIQDSTEHSWHASIRRTDKLSRSLLAADEPRRSARRLSSSRTKYAVVLSFRFVFNGAVPHRAETSSNPRNPSCERYKAPFGNKNRSHFRRTE